MADLPLLVFPSPISISPPKGKPFPPSDIHLPSRETQAKRLSTQLDHLKQDFSKFKGSMNGALAGLEPESVLVIEIAGSVDDFKRAVDHTDGLDWLGEWDLEDIAPNEDFFVESKDGKRTEKPLGGRLYLSMVNEQGLRELMSLWKQWSEGKQFKTGKTKWRDVFSHIREIRPWGIRETLEETGMIDRWRTELSEAHPSESITCQIELFYRETPEKRKLNETTIRALLQEIGGEAISSFIDMQEIAFHAVKVKLPSVQVRHLLSELDSPASLDIQLFKFPGVMYFRPTGQSMSSSEDEDGVPIEFPEGYPDLPPVVAILDGVPNLQHEALQNRLQFDDPDNLSAEYQPGERIHGTSMASLVIHGELNDGKSEPLDRQVYFLPIMQPNINERHRGNKVEHFPEHVFFEDRVERAVKRMIEGEGDIPAQAPNIKVINLSIGDPERPFIDTLSPWARLLDYLSWRYRVLFCVSAGNYVDKINIGVDFTQFQAMADEEKVEHILKCISDKLSNRRILSPAESLNALTVGGLHTDQSGNYYAGNRTDILPHEAMLSPISRQGHGFRRSIKPEIFLPAGRQLYATPFLDSDRSFKPSMAARAPGQKVACDSDEAGNLRKTVFTRGTSNSAALATRASSRIYEVLEQLQSENSEQIQPELIAVLIKALLVHGAKQADDVKSALTGALKTTQNSRAFKSVLSRYIGYGAVDIERVLACTEQRGTVLGCSEIRANEIHEYQFPIPLGLSGQKVWRRMTVTLAWFTPLNTAHRHLREAKLAVNSSTNWGKTELQLVRQEADHNQVHRGTVQHEIFEGEKQISAFQDGESIFLHVTCKADATAKLDHAIPYGLAVTLEVAEGVAIPIYQQIRDRIRPKVGVGAR